MKKKMLCAAFLAAAALSSCSSDSETIDIPNGEDAKNVHLDLWLSVEGTSATGNYVARVDDPTDNSQIVNVNGSGVEVTGKLTYGAIQKDGYYYFATEGNDGLVKYQITKTQIVPVETCPYKKNIFKKGRMTGAISASHEWIGNDVLLLSQYNSTTKKHVWSKYNTKTMTVVEEGEFDLMKRFPDAYKFSTSGHFRYRASDGKLLFFTSIHYKGEGNHPMTGAPNTVRGPLAVVVLDEKTMEITSATTDDRISGLALEAYGDTQQEKAYFDNNGDLYLICLQKGSTYSPGGPIPECVIVRMKDGESTMDQNYLFTPSKDTNILILKYLSPGKAIVFAGDHDRYYNGNKGDYDSYNYDAYYYGIFDSQAKTITRLKKDGSDLPWSTGGFNNYIARIGDKMYLGVNALKGEFHQANVYSLDVNTLSLSDAFKVDGKLNFLRMYSVNTSDK